LAAFNLAAGLGLAVLSPAAAELDHVGYKVSYGGTTKYIATLAPRSTSNGHRVVCIDSAKGFGDVDSGVQTDNPQIAYLLYKYVDTSSAVDGAALAEIVKTELDAAQATRKAVWAAFVKQKSEATVSKVEKRMKEMREEAAIYGMGKYHIEVDRFVVDAATGVASTRVGVFSNPNWWQDGLDVPGLSLKLTVSGGVFVKNSKTSLTLETVGRFQDVQVRATSRDVTLKVAANGFVSPPTKYMFLKAKGTQYQNLLTKVDSTSSVAAVERAFSWSAKPQLRSQVGTAWALPAPAVVGSAADTVTDTVWVEGGAPNDTVQVTSRLFGPFDVYPGEWFANLSSVPANVQAVGEFIASVKLDGAGNGKAVFTTARPTAPGYYVWWEESAAAAVTDAATTTFGVLSETFLVPSAPSLSSHVSSSKIKVGDEVSDTLIVTGLRTIPSDPAPVIKAVGTLYGPRPARVKDGKNTCEGVGEYQGTGSILTFDLLVYGDGTFVGGLAMPTQPGCYSYGYRMTGVLGGVTLFDVSHEPGDPAQTFLVEPSTSLSSSAVRKVAARGAIFADDVVLSGYYPNRQIRLVDRLYGPFDEQPEEADTVPEDAPLVDEMSWDGKTDISGMLSHTFSADTKAAKAGYYVWVEEAYDLEMTPPATADETAEEDQGKLQTANPDTTSVDTDAEADEPADGLSAPVWVQPDKLQSVAELEVVLVGSFARKAETQLTVDPGKVSSKVAAGEVSLGGTITDTVRVYGISRMLAFDDNAQVFLSGNLYGPVPMPEGGCTMVDWTGVEPTLPIGPIDMTDTGDATLEGVGEYRVLQPGCLTYGYTLTGLSAGVQVWEYEHEPGEPTQTATVSLPEINTVASKQLADIGDTVTDEVTVSGFDPSGAPEQVGAVASLYGPAKATRDADGKQTCDGITADSWKALISPEHLIFQDEPQTIEKDSTYTSGEATVAKPGCYTWVIDLTLGGEPLVSSDPGEATETILVPEPEISSQIASTVSDNTFQVTDTITVSEFKGKGTLEAVLYGPLVIEAGQTCADFDAAAWGDAITNLKAAPSETLTIEVDGGGEYTAGPVTIDRGGCVTWSLRLKAGEEPNEFETVLPLGIPSETTLLIAPDVSTVAQTAQGLAGEPVSDLVKVSGLRGLRATITGELYGPVPPVDGSCENVDWTNAPAAATIPQIVVEVDGVYETALIATSGEGCYTFAETLTPQNPVALTHTAVKGIDTETVLLSVIPAKTLTGEEATGGEETTGGDPKADTPEETPSVDTGLIGVNTWTISIGIALIDIGLAAGLFLAIRRYRLQALPA
jgi:hypothetical protein